MWRTSWIGVQLGAVAYLLPFLWSYNDALLLQGSGLANAYAVGTALVAAMLIAKALQTVVLGTRAGLFYGSLIFAGGLAVGSSTVWLGADAPGALVFAVAGAAVLIGLRFANLSTTVSQRSRP